MNTPIIFMGDPWIPTSGSTGGGAVAPPDFDFSDVMFKKDYDPDYDNSVNTLDSLSGIQDLGPSQPNKVIKTNENNTPYWGDDESLDDVDGGTL